MTNHQKPSIKDFFLNHKLISLVALGVLIVLIIVLIILSIPSDKDGVEGDSSQEYDASLQADQRALSTTDAFKISEYLPIISTDPSYQISYLLDSDESGNYTFSLTLSALSASARDAMIFRFLTEDFGKYDPLDYNIQILNYYNPFTNYSLEDLKSNHLPNNIVSASLYSFDGTPYSVRTLTHMLYDGSTNTYRYVLESGEPKTMPQLIFTYSELPFLDHELVKSLNSLK